MSQAGAGAVAAGVTLVVGGIVFGSWTVGDGCGSAFTPEDSGSTASRLTCASTLAGRGNTAWTLTIAGLAVTVGGIAARRSDPTE